MEIPSEILKIGESFQSNPNEVSEGDLNTLGNFIHDAVWGHPNKREIFGIGSYNRVNNEQIANINRFRYQLLRQIGLDNVHMEELDRKFALQSCIYNIIEAKRSHDPSGNTWHDGPYIRRAIENIEEYNIRKEELLEGVNEKDIPQRILDALSKN